jgi:hypothetical protein
VITEQATIGSCVAQVDCVCNGGSDVGIQFLRNSTKGKYVKHVLVKKSLLIF